jgi:acyl carrier protein
MEAAVQERSESVATTVYSGIELVLEKNVDRNDALRLQDELGFDSLRIVTLMSNLSEDLDVDMFEFEEEDLKLETVADLIRILSKHVAQKGN